MTHIFTVTLPDIGEGVVEGEVTGWLKQVGDSLQQDEPVVEVMTDKATVELPAPHPGTLVKQYYKIGEIALVGKPIYDIATKQEVPSAKKEETGPPAEVPIAQPSVRHMELPKGEGRALATPPVRQLAKEMGIDIRQVPGTGKEGRVTPDDLRTHLSEHASIPPLTALEGDEVQPMIGIRKLTAKKVAYSKHNIPHFGFCDKADVTQLIKFRNKIKEEAQEQGVKLTFVPMFVRALSLTLTAFPHFNASVDAAHNSIIVHKPHNIGIAMKTDHGLIVPVMKNVQEMSFQQIAHAYVALKEKAFSNHLKREDMIGSTITLSNFGTEGGLWATPVINFPEVAILATAKIHPEAVVKQGQVTTRSILNCSWSFDHRIIDGDMAAAFSNHFIKLLENPAHLI